MTDLDTLLELNRQSAALAQQQWDVGRALWNAINEPSARAVRAAIQWQRGDVARGWVVDGHSVETRRVTSVSLWRVERVDGDCVWVSGSGDPGATIGIIGRARTWFKASDGWMERV